MKKQKMNLKDIKDVLSREEMKQIMAGSELTCYWKQCSNGSWHFAHWVSSYCYIECPFGSDIICC